jgi:hypothetical protein
MDYTYDANADSAMLAAAGGLTGAGNRFCAGGSGRSGAADHSGSSITAYVLANRR